MLIAGANEEPMSRTKHLTRQVSSLLLALGSDKDRIDRAIRISPVNVQAMRKKLSLAGRSSEQLNRVMILANIVLADGLFFHILNTCLFRVVILSLRAV